MGDRREPHQREHDTGRRNLRIRRGVSFLRSPLRPKWRGYPLGLMTGNGWFDAHQQLTHTVKRHLLASLLDASAAHHGACLGIVTNAQFDSLIANGLISDADRWTEANLRRVLFSQSTSFFALSRRQRLELLSMDGATILRQNEDIVTAGAILQVEGGSSGGGRLAAAKEIAKYGVGIKVSQDGPITGWTATTGAMSKRFSLG